MLGYHDIWFHYCMFRFRMVTSFALCTTTGIRGSPWWPLNSGNLLHRMQLLWWPLMWTVATWSPGRPACPCVSNIDTESCVTNGDIFRHSVCATDHHGLLFRSHTSYSDWNSWVNFSCLVLLLRCWGCYGATKGRNLLHRMTSVRRPPVRSGTAGRGHRGDPSDTIT